MSSDSGAAARRLPTLEDVGVLEVTEDAGRLAEAFIEQHGLPAARERFERDFAAERETQPEVTLH
jgi:hypothetical protein